MILPGENGKPPQMVTKPAKLRKKTSGDTTAKANADPARPKVKARTRQAVEQYIQAKKKAEDDSWAKRWDVRLGRFLGLFDPTVEQGLEAIYREIVEEEEERDKGSP